MPASRRTARDGGALALGLVAGLALATCYKPNIVDGGFLCAPMGKQCPDGFRCVAGHCASTSDNLPPTTDGGGDAPPDGPADSKRDVASTEGGGDTGSCKPPTALCSAGPAAGQACNPSCQTGCSCGRCNVVDGTPTCVAAGTVQLGDVCDANADNCAPGLICLLEMCGNGLARCYRHCTSNDQCGGSACTIPIDNNAGAATGFMTCDVPPRDCDPLAVGASGCPDPALNCYLTNASETLCDCPSNPGKQGMNNDPCTIYNDCASGFICIALGQQTAPRCHFVCDIAQPSCPSNGDGGMQTCMPAGPGAKYGYCSP